MGVEFEKREGGGGVYGKRYRKEECPLKKRTEYTYC